VHNVPTVRLGHISGDLEVRNATEGCQLGHVDGDAALHNTGPVTIGHVAGDLAANRVRELRAGDIAGDCAFNGDEGSITLGTVSGDLAVRLRTGAVQVGVVSGDAAIEGANAGLNLGTVNGDLAVRLEPTAGNAYRANVHGDAAVTLPADSNITLNAVVQGSIVGVGSVRHNQRGGAINVTFGDGSAHLQLTVGGDLALRGPASATSTTWGPDLGTLNEDMAQLGRELGDMGREIAASFKPGMWAGGRGRRHGRRAGVGLDPAQKEQIKREVRETVRSSVEQARASVREALRNIAPPPPPLVPPPPSGAPTPPQVATEDPAPPSGSMTGATVPLSSADQQVQPDTDAERLGILRMVEEGRITPEEAEELLAALEG
jgi:DUF4097 and DUF4098 domain-containing protein YvlB